MVKAIPNFQEEKTERPITWLAWGFGEWKWSGKGGGEGGRTEQPRPARWHWVINQRKNKSEGVTGTESIWPLQHRNPALISKGVRASLFRSQF